MIIDSHDNRVIANPYCDQTTSVRSGCQLSKSIEIIKGVRQGSVFFPLLFNIYSEAVFLEGLKTTNGGNDIVLLDCIQRDLQRLIDAVVVAGELSHLSLNVTKNKVMVCSKTYVSKICMANDEVIK